MKRDLSIIVMQEIQERHITMRPRYYFEAIQWLKRLGFILALGLAIYLTGLVFFKIRFYDPFGYLVFGIMGLTAFYKAIPWHILALTGGSLAIFAYLWRQQEISYRWSFAPAFAAFLFMILVGGFAVDSTKVNEYMRVNGNLTYLYYGHFYDDTWVMGKITEVDHVKKQMTVITPNKEKEHLVWNEDTQLPRGTTFAVGQIIQAVGQEEDEIFTAKGITISQIANSLEWLFKE